MGLYSFTCAKTHLPVLCLDGEPVAGRDLETVMLLERGKAPVEGTLDGYGRFVPTDGGASTRLWADHHRPVGDGTAKLVLKDFVTEGDSFDTLGPSGDDPGQGGLTHDPDFLEAVTRAGGFRSHLGLVMGFHRLAPVDVCVRIDGAAAARHDALVDDMVREHVAQAFAHAFPGEVLPAWPTTVSVLRPAVSTEVADMSTVAVRWRSEAPVTMRWVDGAYDPPPSRVCRGPASAAVGRRSEFVDDDGPVATVRTAIVPDMGVLHLVETADGDVSLTANWVEVARRVGFDAFWIDIERDHPDMVAFLKGRGEGVDATFEVPAPQAPRP